MIVAAVTDLDLTKENRMKMKQLLLVLAIMLVVALPAFADPYHYGNSLIGDRASGMGTAYTAISDDATGLYYNPAGIVYATGKNISASVNAYSTITKVYQGAIAGQDWVRKSSALLPNYFGVVQPLGDFKVGFSYAVPDTSQEDQDQVFTNISAATGRYIIDFNNDDTTYNFGPSIAYELRSNLSVGATLYFHRRRNQFILNQLVNRNDGTNEWTNQYFETTENGLRPIVGVMWSPVAKLSLGLAVSKTFVFSGKTSGQLMCSSSTTQGCPLGTATPVPFYPTLADTQFPLTTNDKRKYPTEISLGAAYFPSERLLVSGDVRYFDALKDATFGDKEAVVNMALGTEYYVNGGLAVRAGLFTDKANTKDVDSNKTNQQDHVDIYGLSTSVSSFTKNTSVTLGGSYMWGDGKAQVISGVTNIQDLHAQGWTVFLSSSYSY